jgi:type II secretory pathway component PulM
MDRVIAWYTGLTRRERLLLQSAGAAIVLVILPLWGFQAASAFRKEAAVELEGAREVAASVQQIVAASKANAAFGPSGDGTLRGLAIAQAEAAGLTVAQVEPAAGDRVRITFQGSDSRSIYRWMEAMTRRGTTITRTTIGRQGDSQSVTAQFELAPAAS